MPAVIGFGFFLKTEQDKKQVEPISLGVGYFTGLLRDFLFALWCWEAGELKYCSRETEKSWGDEMNLQPDEFTGPACWVRKLPCSHCGVCSRQHAAAICGPAALRAQQHGRALILVDGALWGCQQKGWRGG